MYSCTDFYICRKEGLLYSRCHLLVLIQVIKVQCQRLVNRVLNFLLGLLWGKILGNDSRLDLDRLWLVVFGFAGLFHPTGFA